MEIKVRVLNSKDKEEKKEDEFRESLKVKILTPEYIKGVNRDVTARIRQSEANHSISAKDIEDSFFR